MKVKIIALTMVLLMFVVSGVAYFHLPSNVATHWDTSGQANGSMSTFWGAFLLPLISLLLFLVFLALPYIDPLAKNVTQKTYDGMILLLVGFLFYIHMLILLWNINEFNMIRALIPGLALLLYGLGMIVKTVKQNYLIGIRTPWTLSDDAVWEKTHLLGGRLFQLSGLITLVGVFFSDYLLYFFLVPILASVLISVGYSLYLFKTVKK